MTETSKVNKENREKLKSNAVAAKNSTALEKSPRKKVADLLETLKPQLERCLPKHVTPDRIVRVVTSCISKNPELLECSQASFLGAVFATAELGLEPGNSLGLTYLIPFRSKGKLECQFQIGYKGYLELLYRSGRVQSVSPYIVRKQDKYELVRGLEEKFVHEPNFEADPTDKDNEVIFYAIVIKFKDGGHAFDFITPKQARAHGKQYSKSFNSSYSPWSTSFDMMALKTIIKRMMKYQRLSIEQQSAMGIDEGTLKLEPSKAALVQNKDDLQDSIDVEFDTPNQIEAPKDDDKPLETDEAPIGSNPEAASDLDGDLGDRE